MPRVTKEVWRSAHLCRSLIGNKEPLVLLAKEPDLAIVASRAEGEMQSRQLNELDCTRGAGVDSGGARPHEGV